ncbi:hypothetical protein CI109_102749 [Kwoniella shandongensis]|uniref:Uncharacterized protein n=1 Tax=Kwoniella shandongensis TaxID=1734106 RepID=A0A5M6BZ59_9TREE|nr:uncharacterized protein CI109_004928 [Kwoniella shandongensis]KAA5526725.1 hypothetical protein CI109_004928 [Kwoniella shandongensis]
MSYQSSHSQAQLASHQTLGQQQPPPVPAQPPSRSEIERKLSFKSAAPPSRAHESPKKKKSTHPPPPHASHSFSHPHSVSAYSGNESDSSSIASSNLPPTLGSPNQTYQTSPIISPATTSVGLSAIAERRAAMGTGMGPGEELDELMELEDVEEEAEGEGESGSEDEMENMEGQLERGVEGERVIKSGYLYKKQERRKAWKRRWFVLRTGKLAYYKDEKEYSLKRVIDLREVHTVAPVTVKKHQNTFGIVTQKRSFFAKANSQSEMEDWVHAINGVRRRISEREEEERVKREKSESGHHHALHVNQQGRTGAVPIPGRERSANSGLHSIDTTSLASTNSYFAERPTAASPQQMYSAGAVSPTLSSGAIIPPSSPLDTTNSLTSQFAKISIPTPRTPSAQSMGSPQLGPGMFSNSPRQPAGGAMSQPISRGVSGTSTRREPSAGSQSSTAEYFPRGAIASQSSQAAAAAAAAAAGGASSEDEDEGETAYFADMAAQGQGPPPAPVDPNKVILAAYLMKRSKGRGRKVWRKRWFVLTSQGVTYTKSHMDNRALRFIPLSSVLDALEVEPGSPAESESDSDQPASAHSHGQSPPPARQAFHSSMRGRLGGAESSTSTHGHGASTPKRGGPSPAGGVSHSQSTTGGMTGGSADENIFRLITAKRTFVLCAPSEEDEIKWLAAFRALLNREREKANAIATTLGAPNATFSSSQVPPPPSSPSMQFRRPSVPYITQQPPTPAGGPGTGTGTSTPLGSGETTPQGGVGESQMQIGNRGRSATYTAKSAVADVVRRFHPERERE